MGIGRVARPFGFAPGGREAEDPKTISITVDYLRSARPTDTFVRAEVVRHGRRVATVRSLAWQDDPTKPVATANVQLWAAARSRRPARRGDCARLGVAQRP